MRRLTPLRLTATVPRLRGGRRYRRWVTSDGILSDPIDLDGPRRPRVTYRTVEAQSGIVVEHRASGVVGSIRSFMDQMVILRDRNGQDRPLRTQAGGFLLDGEPCTLVAPTQSSALAPRQTASGSVRRGPTPARVARASRILVEGIHDAELVEKVWGDDLREVGVVVERLDGMDDLADVVRDLDPGPGRRLGVLLDHLVDGSKESRSAADVRHPHVLVAGTPFVDVWAAVRPGVVGIAAWPVAAWLWECVCIVRSAACALPSNASFASGPAATSGAAPSNSFLRVRLYLGMSNFGV